MTINIHTIDLNFQDVPQSIAAYLVMGPDGPVLVETGPGSTLPALQAGLKAHGVAVSDVKHLLVTHIHLDHAGAAGWWAQQGTKVYVHHVGAPHLIDPSKLLASATRIYGDKMDVLWGDFLAAPAENVVPIEDNQQIEVAGLTFTALNTPGHAWHHHVYQLGDFAFTGDAAGICLAGQPFVDVPAPPPEFKLEVWMKTIDRLVARNFKAIYPTHFGRVENPNGQLIALKQLMIDAVGFVRAKMVASVSRDEMVTMFNEWQRARAEAAGMDADVVHKYEMANPWYMSVDGILRYWKKRDEKKK